MTLIYESEHFQVLAAEHPHIDRDDGGHIVIKPKMMLVNRQELRPEQAVELMKLTIMVGDAFTRVMNRRGVDIGRINYQDNGNWSVLKPEGPQLHIHLYGRAKSAKRQPYGQACYFPHKEEHPEFYRDLRKLTEEDIADLREEIKRLLKENYPDKDWDLAQKQIALGDRRVP